MAMTTFTARAATCDVVAGDTDDRGDGMLRLRRQHFSDIVESQDLRIAGTNRLIIDLDLNPQSGDGELRGSFTLAPTAVSGTWEGELRGRFSQGMGQSAGIARGTGDLAGAVLRIEFQQVADYESEPPCESPKAFFEMSGMILE